MVRYHRWHADALLVYDGEYDILSKLALYEQPLVTSRACFKIGAFLVSLSDEDLFDREW